MANILLHHLHTARITGTGATLDAACLALDERTQQRIRKIENRQLRNRSICSKLMLYQMANDWFGHVTPAAHPLQYDHRGRPSLAGLPLNFSISYQQDWVSVAVTNQGSIGIDVESRLRNNRFTALPAPWRLKLAQCSISKWNELEAYAKYWGTGLGIVFAQPIPVADDMSIRHRPVSHEIDCCVVGKGDIQIDQHYVMLDDVIYSFKNALA